MLHTDTLLFNWLYTCGIGLHKVHRFEQGDDAMAEDSMNNHLQNTVLSLFCSMCASSLSSVIDNGAKEHQMPWPQRKTSWSTAHER
jgi:hypothetical protein